MHNEKSHENLKKAHPIKVLNDEAIFKAPTIRAPPRTIKTPKAHIHTTEDEPRNFLNRIEQNDVINRKGGGFVTHVVRYGKNPK